MREIEILFLTQLSRVQSTP